MKIIGVAGFKNAGKTTLVEKLVASLTAMGYRVSTVKHAHHSFDIDHEGRDSFRHRKAGATEVAVVSAGRWAIIHELRNEAEPPLADILAKLAPCDLVIVEGYKRERIPKLEIYRAEIGKPLLHLEDDWIVAIASDAALPDASVPVVDLNAIDKIADILLAEAIPVERLDLPVMVN